MKRPRPADLNLLSWRLPAGAVLLLVAAIVAGLFYPGPFFLGYLSAFILATQIPLGAAAILMLHHLVGGRWGQLIGRALLAGTATLPLLILLFVPVLVGVGWLYPWIGKAHADEAAWFRDLYLNTGFYYARSAAYLVVWAVGALGLVALTRRRERAEPRGAAPAFASVGLIVYVLTISFASVDWIASLQEHWYSSVVGLYFMLGQVTAGMAFAIIATVIVARREGRTPAAGELNDLGNLLLAFVILHAYLAYSQLFVIWNGNLPHRVVWYEPRMDGAWAWVSVLLILMHFLLPMFALLQKAVKGNPRSLLIVAWVVLGARAVEAVWLVLPSVPGIQLGALLLAVPLMGSLIGLWLALFARTWRRIPFPGPVSGGEPAV